MQQIIKLINRALNVSTQEWPRIAISWSMTTFLKIGYVIGWTLITAMFVNRFGINSLPFFFILNSLFIIIGTLIYTELLEHINKENLITGTIITGAIFLLLATFVESNNYLFFTLILIAESILLGQLHILISLFTEDLFTPLESQRTFPIIESSETIGGLLGGLVVISFLQFMPLYKFIYLWIAAIVMIIPCLLLYIPYSNTIPFLKKKKKIKLKKNFLKSIDKFKKNKFLKGLLIIIFLQWTFHGLLEFQYTKAIDQSISALGVENYEKELAFKLGYLASMIYAAALFFQLFVTSRILQSIGIIGGIALHILVSFMSIIGLTFRFNLSTAVLSKTNYSITKIIFHNAYHSSYYVVPSTLREKTKEFLEGFVKPLGIIFGTFLIILINSQVKGFNSTLIINFLMLVTVLVMALSIFKLRHHYTEQSIFNLFHGNLHTKLNAIEILAQKGHKKKKNILTEALSLTDVLFAENQQPQVQTKILQILGRLKKVKNLPAILDALHVDNINVKLAALDAISEYEHLGKSFYSQAFSRHRVVKTLKDLFHKEHNEEIRSAIINTFSNLKETEAIQFLIETIQETEGTVLADCIAVCGKFKDPSIAHYISQHLYSENRKIKANTIIALWQFSSYRKELKTILKDMKNSDDIFDQISAIDIIGSAKLKSHKKYLLKMYQSKDEQVKLHAAISLAKIGLKTSLNTIVSLLLSDNTLNLYKVKKLLKELSKKQIRQVKNKLFVEASNRINQILNTSQATKLNDINRKSLQKLKHYYEIVGEENEAKKIRKILKEKHQIEETTNKSKVYAYSLT